VFLAVTGIVGSGIAMVDSNNNDLGEDLPSRVAEP
jgi:hypothetical protein